MRGVIGGLGGGVRGVGDGGVSCGSGLEVTEAAGMLLVVEFSVTFIADISVDFGVSVTVVTDVSLVDDFSVTNELTFLESFLSKWDVLADDVTPRTEAGWSPVATTTSAPMHPRVALPSIVPGGITRGMIALGICRCVLGGCGCVG